MFSKACEYGIRATLYVAEQSAKERRVGIKEIAESTDSPEAFTAKILQNLVKNNIVNSMKGPTGGFYIESNQLSKIYLEHIVRAIDGDSVYKGCGLGLKTCDAKNPCPAHHHFVKIRGDLKIMLENTSVLTLIKELDSGKSVLKR